MLSSGRDSYNKEVLWLELLDLSLNLTLSLKSCMFQKQRRPWCPHSLLQFIHQKNKKYYKHTVDQYESDLLFVAHSLVLSINEKDLHIVKPFPCNGSCIRFYLKFQLVLWGLKLWARRRGIYCNLVGFFGGIHLAVLTTFICCRFPNASGTTLISRFFETYTFWPWPTPVMLQGDLDAMALVAANKGNPMQEIVEQVRDRSTVFTCFQNSGLFKFLLLEFSL